MAAHEQGVEISGADVEQAIAKGLAELGLERSDVNIEVIDSGSSGFLGIGSREATVKLTVVAGGGGMPSTGAGQPEPSGGDEAAEEALVEPSHWSAPDDDAPVATDGRKEEEVALEIVNNLLEKMQFEATTSLEQTEPDDLTGERLWVIDITGQDLGMLIGTRGETLNALQHVARLMTGHSMKQRPRFIIDVEGYRARREQALSRLADRMATKVDMRGKPMTLEPMPPNERRIIHITLRDDERVRTESFGEGRQRKVRIYPAED
ncbi:MAG TPA: RNA-binding cell elongation regulator Jag/EloR [candidate division Zixibacteria bacterium]|nr:RNA-binding cell elongation regulator Jag/EloR [candidate division Zixibacteria bacterium]